MSAKPFILAIMCGALLCFSVQAQEQGGPPPPATEQQAKAPAATEGQNDHPAKATTETQPTTGSQATEAPASPSVPSGDYKIDAAEIAKKPYHIGGFAEFRPVVDGIDDGAAFYKANFYDLKEGGTVQEYNSRAQLDGSWEKGIVRVFARGNISYNNTYQGWSSDSKLYEGYLALKHSDSWNITLGKQTFKWGKGYAWTPVAFIDRPKDPTDPDLALEGFWAASAQYLRSFHGPLKTFSFTSVLLPVFYNVFGNTGVNDTFAGPQQNVSGGSSQAPSNQVNMAAKAYFLLYNTDIDLVFFTGQTKTTRYGFDFSRNIGPRLEVHGELASISGFQKKWADANGILHSSTYDALSSLLGVRYLSSKQTTYILEYYENGTGYTRDQMVGMFSYVDSAYNTYVNTGNIVPIEKASNVVSANSTRNSPMQDYLYLRISQDQPFRILYYTPAISSIVNLRDRSFQIIPELTVTRITNWEIRFRTYVQAGGNNTDFGEKQYNYRVELRIRRFF